MSADTLTASAHEMSDYEMTARQTIQSRESTQMQIEPNEMPEGITIDDLVASWAA